MRRLGDLLFVSVLFSGLVSLQTGCNEAPDATATVVERLAGSSSNEGSDPPLLVYVSDDGLTRLGGEELLDDASILTRARDYQAAHPRGLAVVRCAPAAIHGRMRRVVELLEEASIPYVAIDRIK